MAMFIVIPSLKRFAPLFWCYERKANLAAGGRQLGRDYGKNEKEKQGLTTLGTPVDIFHR